MNERAGNAAIANTLRDWWHALQPKEDQQDGKRPVPGSFGDLLGRADRARLRRARTLPELLMDPAAIMLDNRLLKSCAQHVRAVENDEDLLHVVIALTAGVLVHATVDLGEREATKSLATRLGEKIGDRRLMSELRFRMLQAARKPEDLLRQNVRALAMAGNEVNVGRLGMDLLLWFYEIERPPRYPASSVRYRWARDYYLATAKELATDDASLSEPAQDA